jgi:L-malate glycosyltransferase
MKNPCPETESPEAPLPRVLMALDLDPSLKFGTLEEQMFALARAFQARSGRFLPLYRRGLDPEGRQHYADEGLDAEALDLSRFTPSRLCRLLALIRRERIEVVHWNFYAPLLNPYLLALSALAPSLTHVFTDHISRPGDARPSVPASGLKAPLKRLLAGRYESIVCVSEFVRERLETEGIWPKVRLGTHFVNTDRFVPDAETRRRVRAEYGVEDRFVALLVAHLIPEKGVDVALRAWEQLPGSALLWVIGDGPEAARLQTLADELGIRERVRWLGLQRHVEPFMQAADCALCPSVWAEAAGLVNIEALSAGLPVIASRIGGIPEIIADGRTGYLVPAGDVDALADRLLLLVNDPSTRRALATAARGAALACYRTAVVLPEHLDFYRGLRRRGEPAQVVARVV